MKVFGIIGWKNSGKTGLMERLVADISGRGYSVSTIKHAHHAFDVDYEGKDSYRHREAGAKEVLLASRNRWALMHELRGEAEPSMDELLAQLSPCDLVLVEGYKGNAHQKIEVHLGDSKHNLIARDDLGVVGVASDQTFDNLMQPSFDIDDTRAISTFILQKTGLGKLA